MRRAPRTDLRRAGLVLFGVWALVHVVVFSFQQGTFHPYYVARWRPRSRPWPAPALVALWRLARDSLGLARRAAADDRRDRLARRDAARAHAGLRARAADRDPGRRGGGRARARRPAGAGRFPRRALAVAAVAGALALAAGPAAYSAANVGRSLNGNNVIAGGLGSQGGRGGGRAAARRRRAAWAAAR